MVDETERRIYELVSPWCARNWLTRKQTELIGSTSLNQTLNLDHEDTAELLINIFSEFGLDPDDVDLSVYYPARRRDEIPLTIEMIVSSVKAGKWLYR